MSLCFLCEENIPKQFAEALAAAGLDIATLAPDARGSADRDVLARAIAG